ncbi:type II toxin-antitoxin system HigB family toxin [uncultured Lamprocystis sp.]|jgi:antitoxin component HigA of HigAB toxin-antitoxin module|uniref:type II toxin-antitoxin system HigB family toxin n=1 Tax=uncultured Lamprocystis sp. TaxID=543132 RepID=UPI0025F52CEA|nr:type II toxin-antitoxin system HigB family toxin [uncultured Lamprocystis sp.]
MRIISNRALRSFITEHPKSTEPLAAWRRTIEKSSFARWSDLKAAFNAVDRVGDLIADYEAGEPPLPAASGVETLAFLMEQHGLGPADLPEIGDEGQVQEVLTERRDLDIRQLRALGQRFGVSPGTFV